MERLRIALLFLIVWMFTASIAFSFTCKEAERNALLRFKSSFIKASQTLDSWVGQDCCNWKGVGCDNFTSNVISLVLGIDPSLFKVAAIEVNPSLLELKYLRYLDLSGAYFVGSRMPCFFGSMRQLRYLDLSNGGFVGMVPHTLGNLTKLRVLDLGWNFGMETNNLEWAFKLESLQYIDLTGTDLSKALNSLHILDKLPSLLVLELSSCQLGNSHQVMRNSTVRSSDLQHLELGFNYFSESIPHFIRNLSSIRYLDLSDNQLNSPIPSWLGNKIELRFLSLAGNDFKGSVSGFIQNLSFLTSLDLSYNQFSSLVPSLLSNKIELRFLRLAGNDFKGSFPGFIQNLSFLTSLDLSSNQFNSLVPSWSGNKIELRSLSLASNNLKGPFPGLIQNLSFLTSLDLSQNQLSSSIPSWLANKTNLVSLDLSYNQFDRVNGGIMNTITHLCSLKYLDFSNNLLIEEMSESCANYSMCNRYNLEHLDLHSNSISGHFPMIGSFSSLVYLDLSYNNLSVMHQISSVNLSSLSHLDLSFNSLTLNLSFDSTSPFQLKYLRLESCKLNNPFPKWLLSQENITTLDMSNTGLIGPLPDNIGYAFPSLKYLGLANNQINGSIPISLCVPNLRVLDLHKNRLSGMIPDCLMNGPQLYVLQLSSNQLSGSIPNIQGKSGIEVLSLSNNSFGGELPLSLHNCNELEFLDASKNNLHGKIPPWNGTTDGFPCMHVLILRENKFKGVIPPQLCSIKTLQILDLAQNNLVGTIPPCFGHFSHMPYLFMPTNNSHISPSEWSAMEFIKGEEREYDTVLQWLVNIDLSSNALEGVIPHEFTNISLLVNLNLSRNHLTGFIPKKIGNMKHLESLDLSYNDISGPIPTSFSSLNFLSTLNLSFNKLQGQIPTGNQLQTLNDPSIYIGNPGLCGDPLPKKCCKDSILAHPPTSTITEDEEEDKRERMWFYLVVVCGFATGFWGVILVLVVKKRWRLTYFGLAEELADWLYVRIVVIIARAIRER